MTNAAHDLLPDYLTERADQLVFGQCPMLMVPQKGELPPCPEGARRYLAAADGIWCEARTPALHLRVRVAALPLPYGPVDGVCALAGGKLPEDLTRRVAEQACQSAPSEMAALAAWRPSEERYELLAPNVKSASAGHVTYDSWTDRADCHLAIDIHSHGHGKAFFSPTDDASDQQIHEPHLSVVLGDCRAGSIQAVTRACIGHHLITLSGDPFAVPVRTVC